MNSRTPIIDLQGQGGGDAVHFHMAASAGDAPTRKQRRMEGPIWAWIGGRSRNLPLHIHNLR